MKVKYHVKSCRQIVNNLPAEYYTSSKRVRNKKNNKFEKLTYLNEAVTFDIETTSYTLGYYKTCWMYCWQFYFHGEVYMGRSWDEFRWFLDKIAEHYAPVIVPVYVHNLAFEFSFMRKFLEFTDVFCVRELTPVRARYRNIEFRDSLVLSGLPLAKLGTKTKKLVGDLDYGLIRTEVTPLTAQEISYCVNDVVVLKEYIEQKLTEDTMATIPMTRTGYVRRDVKKRMKGCRIRDSLKLTYEQYSRFEQLFAGGFTHAGADTCGMRLYNVRSLDITSSYPTVMVCEKFPMTGFRECPPERYEWALKKKCCIFKLRIENVACRESSPDCIISASKCLTLDPHAILSNGRVDFADFLEIMCNEVDYRWYRRCYDGEFSISEMEIADPGYLPKPFVEAVLYYYSEKTKFKGVIGKEDWYRLMKECINALYGMAATKPLKPPVGFEDGEWKSAEEIWCEDADGDVSLGERVYYENAIENYNDDVTRCIYYPWAAWVTSYARQNLFQLMWKCGTDWHYSDTDSLKISNYFNHKKQFDDYNRHIVARIREVLTRRKIDPMLACPKDPSGTARPLGVFTDEGNYFEFKTLGAKRYLSENIDGIEATVAGAPKKPLTKYLSSKNSPFAEFHDQLVVPKEKSGKQMCTHVKEDWEGMVTDYTGRTHYVFTHGGVHLEPMEVTLSLSDEYAWYLYCASDHPEVVLDIGMI